MRPLAPVTAAVTVWAVNGSMPPGKVADSPTGADAWMGVEPSIVEIEKVTVLASDDTDPTRASFRAGCNPGAHCEIRSSQLRSIPGWVFLVALRVDAVVGGAAAGVGG